MEHACQGIPVHFEGLVEPPRSLEMLEIPINAPIDSPQYQIQVQPPPSVSSGSAEEPGGIDEPRPSISSHSSYQLEYLGDSGYMPMFSSDADAGRATNPANTRATALQPIDNIPPVLSDTHLDVYFEFASTWCPILDRETYQSCPQFRHSLLLKHALALCSNQIRPALIEQASSADHYQRAKDLFHANNERNPLVIIISLMLFYWFSADGPNTVSIDNTWWWTGTIIRLAQQMRLHRQSDLAHPLCEGDTPGLRRRIWWTLVVCPYYTHGLLNPWH